MGKSLAETVAELPEDERNAILSELDPTQLEYDWSFWSRPEQKAPEGFWTKYLIVAGRGFGKSRAGAEWVREVARDNPGCRIALVARTTGDINKVMIYGESGIMAVHPEDERPVHRISKGRLEWPNGSIAETFSAEEPNQLRGPQFHFAWADEAASWKFVKDESGLNAWDNLNFAVRLGEVPQIVATTTPRRTQFMIELLDDYAEQEAAGEDWDETSKGRIVISRGSTYDNLSNLAPVFLNELTGKYAGTNIAQQELMGEMLDEKNGALWDVGLVNSITWFNDTLPQLPYKIVAIDPSVAENPRDECGIVVVGATGHKLLHKRHAFILEDASLLGSPDVWARKAVEMANKYCCPIVAEGTQGQQLVANMIRSIDPDVKVLLIQTGNRGKKARAEIVLPPYQQKRVHHVPGLEQLELQLTTWDPEVSKKSPDRLDALVHGVTALLVKVPKGLHSSGLVASSTAKRQLPTGRGTGLSRMTGLLGKNRR